MSLTEYQALDLRADSPKASKLREWIDEGCAMVQIEEQEKQINGH